MGRGARQGGGAAQGVDAVPRRHGGDAVVARRADPVFGAGRQGAVVGPRGDRPARAFGHQHAGRAGPPQRGADRGGGRVREVHGDRPYGGVGRVDRPGRRAEGGGAVESGLEGRFQEHPPSGVARRPRNGPRPLPEGPLCGHGGHGRHRADALLQDEQAGLQGLVRAGRHHPPLGAPAGRPRPGYPRGGLWGRRGATPQGGQGRLCARPRLQAPHAARLRPGLHQERGHARVGVVRRHGVLHEDHQGRQRGRKGVCPRRLRHHRRPRLIPPLEPRRVEAAGLRPGGGTRD
mmetsp:Transcript_26972/g.68463  ORF Transcript_26972/g.68463 Transcript_26972/m.68463 type:complete len:290 (+) Transcript_26972:781-1650(+)